ncbi:hypothetical protein I6F30_28490 [Bradyrhizobium sp. NBAIM20]|uniref:hypothetical protein n=1 Tax=unclassified Bradyrhizobium TaxID=2631580 RepID=UPI001CD58683|nr:MULTISPECIES: hypothetical protein [unclassified Bradyrhizobium]MCA1415038.1 hypothetical protein [Bradyrhizobium sp. NBAIM20]MCA1459947.1 hypothetical protein [Bradyrhizobium sp. NBAIM18]
MTQQFHHSPYGMVVIARTGSMKFLPIMNGGMRRPAARTAFAGACAIVQANRLADGLQPFRDNGIELGFWKLDRLDGPAMNRFVHRIIMSLLLVAALVLIWNVLGAR